MQHSNKPEKMKKPSLARLSGKALEDHLRLQEVKGKRHKCHRTPRPEWEAY